jgi:hypothetical protein
MDVAIRTPLPKANREMAKRCFELGKERNLGISIKTVCTLNGNPCSYIDLPEDESAAQSRLMGNKYIKFSFSVGLRDAREIRNPVLWRIKQLFESKRGYPYWIDDVPSRQTLLPRNFK